MTALQIVGFLALGEVKVGRGYLRAWAAAATASASVMS